MKKRGLLTLLLMSLFLFAGCEDIQDSQTELDKNSTLDIANKLASNQPTPTDIDYSLERYP